MFLERHFVARCTDRTMFFGVLDPERGMLHYCNAGHNHPYLIGGNGKLRESGD